MLSYARLPDEQKASAPTDKTRTVALIDVDQTLINDHNVLNEKLIADLLSQGIRDLYLFTHMSLSDITEKVINPLSFSRKQLIEQLQAKGFTVHGVITPADPSYNRGLGAAFQEMYLPQYERIGKPLTEENIQADAAFQKLNQSFREHIGATKVQAEKNGHQSVKGEMYKYFLQNRPAWVGSVLFFDDAQENLDDAVLAGTQVPRDQQLRLTTVKVNKNFNEAYAAQIKKHQPKQNLLSRVNAVIERHPRIWQAMKWLVLGALAATALYFSGGLAALPYVAQLGAWAIPAATPFLAIAKAALWTFVLKPIGTRLLKICGFPRPPVVLPVNPTHARVVRELDSKAEARPDKDEEKAIEKAVEDSWYSAEQLERLIYAPQKSGRPLNGLKYVFMAQDFNGDPSFKTQLTQMRMLRNQLKAPFACFITTEPGQFNTSHFILGLVVNNRLLIINPLGETQHRAFYEQIAAAREKLRIPGQGFKSESVILSASKIQKDERGLVSCGPICAELLRHLSSLSAEQLSQLLDSAEKTQQAHDLLPEYQTLDLRNSGLLPPSLQGLLDAEPREYGQRMEALRREHQEILQAEELAPEAYDERNLLNQLLLKEENVFTLRENEAFKRLHSRFAAGPSSSFGPGSPRQFAANNTVPRLGSGKLPSKDPQQNHRNTGPQ